MEYIALVLSLLVLGVACANLIVIVLPNRRRRAKQAEREKNLAEALKLATNVLDSATIGRTRATAIPVNSPEGRALLDLLRGGPCSCPNCEEERRIAHAEQNRDEK